MKLYLYLILLVICSSLNAETAEKYRESNDYKYSSLGVHFIESEKSGIAINLSIGLPGSFYLALERKADGIDYKNESYEKVVDSLRLGAFKGIGDLIGSISAGDVKFKIKNLFDIFAEVGVKTSEFDGEKFNFEGEDTYASYIAGIRFGNSNNFEGRLFVDVSKEARIIDSGNPTCLSLVCPPYQAELSDESDKKFGASILYNVNNRNAIFIELTSSNVIENTVKIGYQFNF